MQRQFGVGISKNSDFAAAVDEACASAAVGGPADLAFVFFTPEHTEAVAGRAAWLFREVGAERLLGCSAETVVAGGREIEVGPALVVWKAVLPDVELHTAHLEFQPNSDGGVFIGWTPEFAPPGASESSVVLLGDPFSFPADEWLRRIGETHPGLTASGGMASGGHGPRTNRLILNEQAFDGGAVAVRLVGKDKLRTATSQGCRPIGQPMVVTKADRNVIETVGGRSTLEVLQELYASLSVEDQQLFRTGLHVGRVVNEYRETFGAGDFLIRNVMGVEPQTGGVMIGDYIRAGQTVQFHIRDAGSAGTDLSRALAEVAPPPAGALLFTCNGRGTRMFAAPDHDAGAIVSAWPNAVVAGLSCAGEIGAVGGKNFLHGFTASVAAF